MDGKFNNSQLITEQEESDNTQESGPESPPSTVPNDMKMTSLSSPKRSKRGIQKRVVSVPIKDIEGSRMKGESAPPPSDSWAWRKYGQKPIKGSPYPRGYYRCSSSKGCPARKQVERSRVDPTMLVVTYSCEHNHPWPPPSRSHHHHHHHHHNNNASAKSPLTKPQISAGQPEDEKFGDLGEAADHEFAAWFGEMETTSSSRLLIGSSPIFAEEKMGDVAMYYPMREEDESLFADLGELPECTAVFSRHHRGVGPEVQIC